MLIPSGFGTLAPHFTVSDAPRFVAFLKAAFDAEEIGMSRRADGTIANAQLRIGTSSFMIGEASDRYGPMPGSFYLYVENADATLTRALAQSATLEMAVADTPYGDRQGGVVDPFGNIWWISQRLVDAPYY